MLVCSAEGVCPLSGVVLSRGWYTIHQGLCLLPGGQLPGQTGAHFK